MKQTKITKYKWVDAGGGNYDLEVSLKLDVDLSGGSSGGSSSGSIGKQIQLENGVDKDKYFEGVGVNKSTSQQQFRNYLYKAFASFTIDNIYSYKKDKKPWTTTSFFKHQFFGQGTAIDLEADAGLGKDFVQEFNKAGKGANGNKAKKFYKNTFNFIKDNVLTENVKYTREDSKGNKLFAAGTLHAGLPTGTYWLMKKKYSNIVTFSSQPSPPYQNNPSVYGPRGVSVNDINIDPVSKGVMLVAFSNLLVGVAFKNIYGIMVAAYGVAEQYNRKFVALGNVNVHIDFKIIEVFMDEFLNITGYKVQADYSFPNEKFEDVLDLFNDIENGKNYDLPATTIYKVDHNWQEIITLDENFDVIKVD